MKKNVLLLFGAFVMLAAPTSSFLPAQNRPPVHWISGGDSMAVKQGETFDFQAQFFSDVAIPNARWTMVGSVKSISDSDLSSAEHPNGFIGNVEPNHVYSIQVHLQIPQNHPQGQYTGNLSVWNWNQPGHGNFQMFPEYLKTKIYVMDSNP